MDGASRAAPTLGRAARPVVLLGAAVVLVALWLAGGCGGEADTPTPSVTLSAPQSGAAVEATIGGSVVIRLEANATTGYEWVFREGETFTIDGSEYVPHENPEGLVGVGGTQVVTLTVTQGGSSKLVGTYARSWESPSPGAEPDFILTVTGIE